MPKVSVIIPTYNYAHYISKAIDSVMLQTFKDFEVIVIDDGSTDNTKEIVNDYLLRFHGKISYFYQKNNGPSVARNKGLSKARGEYIAFLDADDIWLPRKLEKSLNFILENKLDWACTSRLKLTKESKYIVRRIEPHSGIFDTNTKIIMHLETGLFNTNYTLPFTSTIIIKKACFDKTGFFDETLRGSEDLDLWLRLQESGLIGGHLDEPLIIYNSHQDSLSRTNNFHTLQENYKVAKKHAKILKFKKFLKGRIYGEFLFENAISCIGLKKYFYAFKYCFLSTLYYPQVFYSILKKVSKKGFRWFFEGNLDAKYPVG